jgi:hypothetical protein
LAQQDYSTNIDELILNVLGGTFFKKRQIRVRLIPVAPKGPEHNENLKKFKNIS